MKKEIVRTIDLRKSFFTPGGELKILKGIDLVVYSGEMVAVVGASGTGKSTLLHILGTLDRPTSGKVYIDGIDVFNLPDDKLSRFRNLSTGFVFQFHHLLPEFTVKENILMPFLIQRSYDSEKMSLTEAIERADYLMNELGIYERRDHRPQEISGGEQQRTAVARALMLNPKIVLLDEPTGNLDILAGRILFELLIKLNIKYNITFIVVTHNMELAGLCSRLLRLVDGRLMEEKT